MEVWSRESDGRWTVLIIVHTHLHSWTALHQQWQFGLALGYGIWILLFSLASEHISLEFSRYFICMSGVDHLKGIGLEYEVVDINQLPYI